MIKKSPLRERLLKKLLIGRCYNFSPFFKSSEKTENKLVTQVKRQKKEKIMGGMVRAVRNTMGQGRCILKSKSQNVHASIALITKDGSWVSFVNLKKC